MELNNVLVDEFNEDIKTIIHNPIQQLQMMTVALSGVSLARAFAIDEGKAIGKILPDYVITALCEAFYRRVYMSEEESKGENPAWFKDLFKNKTLEEGIQDLSEYLMQRLGGKRYYTERKGTYTMCCRILLSQDLKNYISMCLYPLLMLFYVYCRSAKSTTSTL